MKCALIIPSWYPDELFPAKTAGAQINYWQPLGTLYVAACLQQAGHEVRFLNGAFLHHSEILRQIREFRPGFIGIYSTTFGWNKALNTANDIKAIDAKSFICVGGPFPIAMQRQCLTDGGERIDAVVTGEGEITVPEMVNKLVAGKSLHGIQGVIFRNGEKIVENPPRALIEDLDALPFPARDLLGDASRYVPPPATYRRAPVAVMITSRGCNRRCIFCSQIDTDRKAGTRGIRFRSIDNVLQEITLCLEQGYKEIKFIDDTLAADYDRLMRLTQEIKARGLDFTWFASACVNQVDKPLLRAMKQAGCWAILLGAESGVQKNLNTLRKGITLEQTRMAVRAAKEVGLMVSTPFLFGIPGETFEEGLKTIDFAIELKPDLANFHALTAFPGTHLYEHRDQYGHVSGMLNDYTYQGASFVPYSMSREQIHELRQIAFRRFYSRPSFLVHRLLQIRTWKDCQVALSGIKSLFWMWSKKKLFSSRSKEQPAVRGG
jgi:anaerobic magnesium-protoporphyrin IX monomethyl ester cyclase